MLPFKSGVLPDHAIEKLFEAGIIRCTGLVPGQVQPASLDLRLGNSAFRIQASFLPQDMTVMEALERVTIEEVSLSDGLELTIAPGSIFVIPLIEALNLPDTISARANPKSSTGRLDIFVRLLCDRGSAYDDVPAGYSGPLWLEIAPKTFPIKVRAGSRLSQLRFRKDSPLLSDYDIQVLLDRRALVVSPDACIQNGLCLKLDLGAPDSDEPVGWKARKHSGAIDVDKVGNYQATDFFDPVFKRRDGGIILEPDAFYILASKERISVPETHASEMIAYDAGIGSLRAHYAGYVDPGFGANAPSRAVLEVRAHDVPFLIDDGQIIARLTFERMETPPLKPYGKGGFSNYQGQGLKLSKHFVGY